MAKRYMASYDPDFEREAADIIGLYLNPPRHATVFCVDEKSAIQALDRLEPVLLMSPGRFESHRFEYYRHGTLWPNLGLDVRMGKVQAKTAARHTTDDFVEFLGEVSSACRSKRKIRAISDSLSAHKTFKVQAFLDEHSGAQLHFTPTHSSWLNHVEIWFGRLEREVIARGVFSWVRDSAGKLMRYVRASSKTAHPSNWRYSDVLRRLRPC
jgi:hypothetical protein